MIHQILLQIDYFSKKIIKKYNSKAYTTIIKHDEIVNDTAFQIFTKKGPLAFLPISKKKLQLYILYIIQLIKKRKY